jgi:hypothetical protein
MFIVVKPHAARLTMLALAAVLFMVVRASPPLAAEAAAALAGRVSVRITELSGGHVAPLRQIRAVNPALRHIDGWISSVGAAVALGDVDLDGRPNDLCMVDPRTDSVTIRRAPATPAAYPAFSLPIPAQGYAADTIAPMGCLFGDLNEDGRTDVLVYFWGRTPTAYLRRDSAMLSADAFVVTEVVPARERWYSNAATFADVDGDGHQDLLIGNYFRDGARILDPAADGDVEMQHSMSRALNSGRARLLLWQAASHGTVSYADRSDVLPETARYGWTLALGAHDLDGDLRPEIYFANDFGPDRLLHNRSRPGHPALALVEGRRTWRTPRSQVLGRDSFKGMGVDFGDVNDDGRPDIAVSNISRRFALVESHFLFVQIGAAATFGKGIAPFVDEAGGRGIWTGGWAWDLKFVDLDNDGRAELVQTGGFLRGVHNRWPELQELATGNDELLRHPAAWPRFSAGDDLSGSDHERVFMADSRGAFHDIAPALGLAGPSVSRGIAVGDVDGDGRLDLAIARQWMPSLFVHNLSPTAGQALALDLRVRCGSALCPAIGARVVASLPSGVTRTAHVDGGSGHSGKRVAEAHIGLGAVPPNAAIRTRIAWRDAAGAHELTRTLTPGRHRVVLDPVDTTKEVR